MRNRFLGAIVLLGLLAPSLFAAPFGWVVAAYDLTATSYTYCTSAATGTPTCGTAVTDGWYTMPGGMDRTITVVIEWNTKAATSLDYSVECRAWSSSTAAPFPNVATGSLTAVGSNAINIIGNMFDRCRVGLKLTTDTGTNSVTAYFATRN